MTGLALAKRHFYGGWQGRLECPGKLSHAQFLLPARQMAHCRNFIDHRQVCIAQQQHCICMLQRRAVPKSENAGFVPGLILRKSGNFAAKPCAIGDVAHKNRHFVSASQFWCSALTLLRRIGVEVFTVFRCENTTKHQNRRLSDLTTFVRPPGLWQNGAKLSHCMKTRLLHVMFQPRGTINL